MNFKEISRRSMFNVEEGMACGPVGVAAADAEIVIEEDGQRIYLHAQWADVADEEIMCEATRESTYDVYEKINRGEGDFDELIAERDRIQQGTIEDDARFAPLYEELKEMVIQKLKENDVEAYFLEEEEWDEEEE